MSITPMLTNPVSMMQDMAAFQTTWTVANAQCQQVTETTPFVIDASKSQAASMAWMSKKNAWDVFKGIAKDLGVQDVDPEKPGDDDRYIDQVLDKKDKILKCLGIAK